MRATWRRTATWTTTASTAPRAGSAGRAHGSERVRSFVPGKNHLAENIASGASTPQEVVEGWMRSPVHRANVLGATFSELGVGYWPGGDVGVLLGRGLRGRLRHDSPAGLKQQWGRAGSTGGAGQSPRLGVVEGVASPSERARLTSSTAAGVEDGGLRASDLPLTFGSSSRESSRSSGLRQTGQRPCWLRRELVVALPGRPSRARAERGVDGPCRGSSTRGAVRSRACRPETAAGLRRSWPTP